MNTMTRPDDSGDSEDLQALFDSVSTAPAAAAKPAPATVQAIDAAGDSDDLQDLFDSIAGSKPPAPPPPPPRMAPPEIDPAGDSDDLQALFDSVADESAPSLQGELNAMGAHGLTSADDPQETVYNNLGKMARQLHDSLRELGYDKALEDFATQMPDARQRLTYIAQMTEQAASKVLNATDIAKPIVDKLADQSVLLSARWEKMFANQLSVDEFKALAADTRSYFASAPAQLRANSEQLTEIMMAQDFQDLTGQVIKKVVEMAQNVESQLLKVLIDAMPESRKPEAHAGLMNGPVISSEGRDDVVTDQSQVDDLLESLGF